LLSSTLFYEVAQKNFTLPNPKTVGGGTLIAQEAKSNFQTF